MSTNEPKWTPGPWEAKGSNGKYFANHGWTVDHEDEPMTQTVPVHKGGYVVAMVVDADGDDDQFAANANLIAAAPDLYKALSDALDWMDTVEPYLSKTEEGASFDGAPRSQARAALSKALGE